MNSTGSRKAAPRRVADASNSVDQGSAFREVWLAENKEAIQSSNAWVETHGLPLAKHRQF